VVHIDGASRGNPGPAAYAVVVQTVDGKPVASFSQLVGQTTNNVAEYCGLLAALGYAIENRLTQVRVLSDSELLVRQIWRQYKVKSPDLRPLFEQAERMIRQVPGFSISHVPREQNREADKLANRALDRAKGDRGAGSHSPSQKESASALPGKANSRQGFLDLQKPREHGEDESAKAGIPRRPYSSD
jgi:ribonuclease HI